MKLNKKGFVLAETLVVAVFMATIFTIIYVNFYPLIGEYEKREFYDDLDSKYDIYVVPTNEELMIVEDTIELVKEFKETKRYKLESSEK